MRTRTLFVSSLSIGTAAALAACALGEPADGTANGQDLSVRATAQPPTRLASGAPKAKTQSAFVRGTPGATCSLRPEGDPAAPALDVIVDVDGVGRFLTTPSTRDGDVERLTADCTDRSGSVTTSTIDLRAKETFSPPALDLSSLDLRPALDRDPAEYSDSELLAKGYGVRPDPVATPDAYARWLRAATSPMRLRTVATSAPSSFHAPAPHEPRRALPEARTETTQVAPQVNYTSSEDPWTGAVLNGAQSSSPPRKYVFADAAFNLPTVTLGGMSISYTQSSLWAGLDNVFQAVYTMYEAPAGVTFGANRQAPTMPFSNDGGANQQGAPGLPSSFTGMQAGDQVWSQVWYCDAQGNPNIGGGYACSYMIDFSQWAAGEGAGWYCIYANPSSPSACASWPVLPGASIGTQADFIFENDTAQYVNRPGSKYNANAWPDFNPITMQGTAYAVTGAGTVGSGSLFTPSQCSSTPGCVTETLGSDPNVTIDTDWTGNGGTNCNGAYSSCVYAQGPFGVNVGIQGSSVAWTTGTFNPLPSTSIVRRSTGETDIASVGPNQTLVYTAILPSGAVVPTAVNSTDGSTLSRPSMFVRSTGEADIVARGPSNELLYYVAFPNEPWSKFTLPGTIFSAPAIFVRSTGEADVVAVGPNGSLVYYVDFPNEPFQGPFTIATSGATSDPAIFVRSTGEADIVVQGPNNELLSYVNFPSGPWYPFTIPGTIFSAPSIAVRSTGEEDVVAQGAGGSVLYFVDFPNEAWQGPFTVVGANGAYPGTTPALSVSSGGTAAVAVLGGDLSLRYYTNVPNDPWVASSPIAGAGTSFAPPSLPLGYADFMTVGQGVEHCVNLPPPLQGEQQVGCAPNIEFYSLNSSSTLQVQSVGVTPQLYQ